jgi:hypothetical protein
VSIDTNSSDLGRGRWFGRFVRFVHQHAVEWRLLPNRIGTAGFSAGGASVMRAGYSTTPQAGRIFQPVPAHTPPLFLVIGDHTALASKSKIFYHLLSDSWIDLFKNWLAGEGYLS